MTYATLYENVTPVVPYLKVDDAGRPWLLGFRCRSCNYLHVGVRLGCSRCTAVNQFDEVKLAETGRIYVPTVVYRSFPGVSVPFADVIVDLEDGAHLHGSLRMPLASPELIPFDMPVQVTYRKTKLRGRGDEDFLIFEFVPNEEAVR